MRRFKEALVRFLKNEDGPTAIEYAFMLALIIAVCVAAVSYFGLETSTVFQKDAEEIGEASD